MMQIPRIVEVKPQDNMILFVRFENGDKKEMDIKPYAAEMEAFNELKNKTLFNKVKVVFGGFGIAWNKNIDLDRYDIWKDGKTIN